MVTGWQGANRKAKVSMSFAPYESLEYACERCGKVHWDPCSDLCERCAAESLRLRHNYVVFTRLEDRFAKDAQVFTRSFKDEAERERFIDETCAFYPVIELQVLPVFC